MGHRGWIGFCTVVGAFFTSVSVGAQNTWSAVDSGQRIAYCQKMVALTRDDLWVTGEIDDVGGLYVSSDGGLSFERQALGSALLLDWVVLDAERAMALMSDTVNGGTPFVQFTNDRGRTWERRGSLSQVVANRGVLWSQDGQRVLAQVVDGIYQSVDGARNWARLQSEAGRTHFGNGELILMIDPITGDLLRSITDGTSFDFSLPASELQDPDAITGPRVYAVDAELGFAISSLYGLLRTTDAGQTWRPIALPQVNGVSPVIYHMAFAADSSHGLMSVDDGEQNAPSILSTTDGAEHWVFDRLPSDTLANGALPIPGCFAFFSNIEAFAASTTVLSYPLLYIGDDGSESVDTPVDEANDAGTSSRTGEQIIIITRNAGSRSDASKFLNTTAADHDDLNCGCVISRVATSGPDTLIILLLSLVWIYRCKKRRWVA